MSVAKFRATGFSIMDGLGWYSPHQSKNDPISTDQIPSPPNFYTFPIKALLSLLLVEIGH